MHSAIDSIVSSFKILIRVSGSAFGLSGRDLMGILAVVVVDIWRSDVMWVREGGDVEIGEDENVNEKERIKTSLSFLSPKSLKRSLLSDVMRFAKETKRM